MKQISIREWGYLNVSEGGGSETVSREIANGLVAAAATSALGGDEGQNILVNGQKRLRAQQIVGILVSPLATLEILPKIDRLAPDATRKNLVHMLARVLDLEADTGAMVSVGMQKQDLLEVFIRMFCKNLFETVRKGLPRSYIARENDLPALRGRIDILRQFTVLATSPQKLACRYEDLDADVALNQVMKAAISRLARLSRNTENQRQLSELAFAFSDVSAVAVSALPWNKIFLDRTNKSWSSLLRLARLLLESNFQTTSSGNHLGFSLLFEMNVLFEAYVGRCLKRVLVKSGLEIQLQGPRAFVLRDDTGVPRFATKPDIVIRRDGRIVLIVDTKWKRLKGAIEDAKRGVGQADIYQMMAYSHVYQCDRLLLLYPHDEEMGSEEGVVNTHFVQGTENTRLYVGSISLSDLRDVEYRLLKLVQQMLVGSESLSRTTTLSVHSVH
jgi:5-methylcytosine-specific restriction enzyme subunit McrC